MTGEVCVPLCCRKNLLRSISTEIPMSSGKSALCGQLKGVPAHVRQNIINCLRQFETDSLHVEVEDVHFYLEAVRKIAGLENLKRYCENTLVKSLSVHNAVYMLHLAEEHGLETLSAEAKTVLSCHLTTVMCHSDFSTILKQQIQDILELHVKLIEDKDTCLEALKFWAQFADNEDCVQIRQSIDRMCQKSDYSDRRFNLSFATDKSHRLEVLVRDNGNMKLYRGECKKANGRTVKVDPNFAVCTYQDGDSDAPVVLISGGSGEEYQRQVLECDVIKGKWKSRKHMVNGRQSHCLCALNSKVYAFGGFISKGSEKHLVRQIEEYNYSQNTWKEVATLEVPVYDCACATIGNRIFILGGKNEQDESVNSVQIYDTIRKTCTVRCQLPNNCLSGKATAVKDFVYFASCSGHLIRLDTNTMEIKRLCQQPDISSNFTLFPREDGLLISYHKDGAVTSFLYKTSQDSWISRDRFKMATGRVAGQCTVTYPSELNHVPFCD